MRAEKKDIVQEFVNEIENVDPILFTDYSGVKSDALGNLRLQLNQAQAKYRVVHNRLFKRALESAGLESSAEYLKGPLGVAYGGRDAVAIVKLIVKFAKDNRDTFKIKGGVVDNNLLGPSELEDLSKLPSKDVLIGRLVSQIGAPLSRLVMVLQGNIRNLVSVLDNIQKKKAEGGK